MENNSKKFENIFWRKNTQEEKISGLITKLFEFINEEGGFRYEYQMQAARSELLYSIDEKIAKDKILVKTIRRMKKDKLNTKSDFQSIYISLLDENQILASEITVLFPLNLIIKSSQDFEIELVSYKLYFTKNKAILKQLPEQPVYFFNQSKNDFNNFQLTPDIFLVKISLLSGNNPSTWNIIDDLYYTLKGIFEYSLGYLDSRIISWKEEPRAIVPDVSWGIKVIEKDTSWLNIEVDREGSFLFKSINEKQFEQVQNLITIFSKSTLPDSILSLILKALKLYTIARDTKYSHWAFLGYWQVAETITLSQNFNGKTDKVINRLKYFSKIFDQNGFGYDNTLDYIGSLRNKIVHRGFQEANDIEEDVITHLKYHCDIGLRWLILNRETVTTIHHLEYFYQFSSENKINRDRINSMIELINSQNK